MFLTILTIKNFLNAVSQLVFVMDADCVIFDVGVEIRVCLN